MIVCSVIDGRGRRLWRPYLEISTFHCSGVFAFYSRGVPCFRVASSKSGRLYLHTDVRMIIFRKSDLDTATDHEAGKGWELR